MKFKVIDITNNKEVKPIYEAYEGKIFEPMINMNGTLCFRCMGIDGLMDGIFHGSYVEEKLGVKYKVIWETEEDKSVLDYLFKRYDCCDIITLNARCPINLSLDSLGGKVTEEFIEMLDRYEENEDNEIAEIIEERDKEDDGKRYTLEKILKIGLDKETRDKRDKFMGDAREKYKCDVFKDVQTLYIDEEEFDKILDEEMSYRESKDFK